MTQCDHERKEISFLNDVIVLFYLTHCVSRSPAGSFASRDKGQAAKGQFPVGYQRVIFA